MRVYIMASHDHIRDLFYKSLTRTRTYAYYLEYYEVIFV